MRGVSPLLLVSLVAVAFAGCVNDAQNLDPDVPEIEVRFAEPAEAVNLLDPGTPVPIMSTQVSTGAEPAILAAADGSALWIGHHRGGYRSLDGGATWVRMATPFMPGAFVDGWDFAEDAAGTLYATTTNGQVIQVVRSVNDGLSWDLLTRFYPTAVAGVADRPWIAAGEAGDVVLVFNDSGFTNRCQRSSDGGLTWPDQSELGGRPIAGGIVIDEAGHAYWASEGGNVYQSGASDMPTTCTFGFRNLQVSSSPIGRTGQPMVAVEDGVAYVAYATGGNDATKISARDIDAQVIKEFEFGLPELKSNVFHTIDVHDGRIYSAWYGAERDGNFWEGSWEDWWDVYLAVVDDFWTPNPTVQIFKIGEDNHFGDICLGGIGCGGANDRDLLDYFGLDVDANGRAHVAYGHDGTSNTAQVRYVGITPP